MRKATVASKEVLATHGASSIEIGSSTQLHIRNWVFKSSHNSICSSKQLAELARRIESIVTPEQQLRSSDDDNIHINSFSMRLPPMLFLDDTISASYIPAKVEIKVSASDALTTWASKHSASYMHQYPLSIIQVPYAKNWLERSLPNAVFPSSSSTTTPSGQVNANTDTPDIKTTVLPKWDWTFSSDYCFSVSTSSEATILSGRRLADHLYRTQGNALQYPALSSSSIACSDNGTDWEKMEWVCQPAAHSGLDMNLLRQSGPDSPILFYDEVLLYQDDLEDCGEVLYDARIRVMPSCWFMLTRMFVRVDGACVRIKETRLFHAFDADCRASDGSIKIHVVVTWKELDLEPPLTSVVKESNTNTTAKTYTTSAPSSRPGTSNIVNMGPVVQNNNSGIQHLLRKPQELSEKLPVVNNKYAIPQFYTLFLTR